MEINKLEKSLNKILVENESVKTKLISAFPGCGKSHFYKNSSKKVLDSDSSTFDKNNFPENYMNHIKEKMGTVDYILISSHKDVRKALENNKLEYTLVHPVKGLKEDYLKRYEERGSPKNFISLLETNWDNWIDEMEAETYPKVIKLNKDEFLSDVL